MATAQGFQLEERRGTGAGPQEQLHVMGADVIDADRMGDDLAEAHDWIWTIVEIQRVASA